MIPFVLLLALCGQTLAEEQAAPVVLLFSHKDTHLEPGQEAQLDAAASSIKNHPGVQAQVIGHTDRNGRAAELIALSLARAQSVEAALRERGVEASRMMVSGVGGSQPVAGQNNRVEVTLLRK